MMSFIGKRIREIRESLKITRNQLAEKVGISTSMLYYYEKEQKIPSAEVLASICKVLDISADYLLGLTNKKEKSGQEIIVKLKADAKEFEETIDRLIEKMKKLRELKDSIFQDQGGEP